MSDTYTPMHYTAEIAKQKYPDSITVFIGPCLSKRKEAQEDPLVDYVLTFQELQAVIKTKNINMELCQETKSEENPSKYAREFAVVGGVTEALKHYLRIDKKFIQNELVTDLDKKNVLKLSIYADGHCKSNLIEVMACPGGCVGGAGVISDVSKAAVSLEADKKTSEKKSSTETEYGSYLGLINKE